MNRRLFTFSCFAPLACGKGLPALLSATLLTSGGSCSIPFHCDDFNHVSSLACNKEDIIMSPTLKRFFKLDRIGQAILKQLDCARWIPTAAPIEGEDLSGCVYATAAFYLSLSLKVYNPAICTNITPPILRSTKTSTTTLTNLTNITESPSIAWNNFTENHMCPPLDCAQLLSTTTIPRSSVVEGISFKREFARTPMAIILTNSESSRPNPIQPILLIMCWLFLLPYFLQADPIFSMALNLASKAFM